MHAVRWTFTDDMKDLSTHSHGSSTLWMKKTGNQEGQIILAHAWAVTSSIMAFDISGGRHLEDRLLEVCC